MIRKPAVSGQFYPSNPAALEREVKSYFDSSVKPVKAFGIVSPHAGYIYSGRVAGEVFCRVEVPGRVLIMGPNHRGRGTDAAVMSSGRWAMPMGDVALDTELAAKLIALSKIVKEDESAHAMEHSLEVQLPFVQAIREDFLLTPLALGRLSLSECLALGEDLATAIREIDDDVLIVASSDMTHYEPHETAKKKDMDAVKHILDLDPEGLYETVRGRGITMCGVLPVTVMLKAAIMLGAKKAELVDYKTSGETSGDYGSVVGYAGLIVS
ncbi:MAG: AmmeMemoRadiSam system protein B [Deltaproteobacteria bacterium]|uniref:MEMO1 family protein JW984_09870 n=1 Tax=Candidatus Zymogenus saltonus TaxID=2844893 RepID=A0A9D8KFG6_9DELT|nr:AmmeMemoRadiSam system protein B [Candidatus Zymogenus saltonus]